MLPQEAADSVKQKTQPPIKSRALAKQNEQRTRQLAHRLMAKQAYVEAIKLLRDEVRRGIEEKLLAEEYVQAVNGGHVQANTLIQHGDYPGAAFIFKTIQDNFPQSPEVQLQVAVSRSQLANGIETCTKKLMEAGLAAYRSGQFATAIDTWEQVLEIRPDHQVAQNSIQTTRLQLNNLKSMDNKN